MSDENKINALGKAAAYQLADVAKTKPQFGMLTPRWLTKFLEFKGLDSGIYRVNRVKEGNTPLEVLCSSKPKSDIIPQGFVDYESKPREYILSSVTTIININTPSGGRLQFSLRPGEGTARAGGGKSARTSGKPAHQ